MTRGTFGNLEQWGPVLEQLDDWKRTGELDMHQDELLWLLRYRGNWRLREAALDVMATLQAPDPELLRQACEIIMDEDLYQEVRVLAAETVAALLSKERACHPASVLLASEVRAHMHALLGSTCAPVMHVAWERVLLRIG